MATETKKRFTVDDYYKMAEAGIFTEPQRTELINGEVIEVTSMGSRHAAAVSRVNELFLTLFKGRATLRPQLPLRLNDFNEPEPDIALLNPRKDSYAEAHPGPLDVLLVVEIADTSLKYDRDVKLPLYAAAGIPEVWILDLSANTLLVCRGENSRRFGPGTSVWCLSFPDIRVKVDDLLGK